MVIVFSSKKSPYLLMSKVRVPKVMKQIMENLYWPFHEHAFFCPEIVT